MANTLKNTLNKVGNAIEAVMGSAKKSTPHNDPNHVYTGQTCLERFGMEARNAHLLRNEWRKDLAYSKPLVDAEYMIQTEFKVGSTDATVEEQHSKEDKKNQTKRDKVRNNKVSPTADQLPKESVVGKVANKDNNPPITAEPILPISEREYLDMYASGKIRTK
jgi:hypothetical protein